MPAFVDLHSHVVPAGDDGAQTFAQGLELCELAARSGTEVLYATPHVSPVLPLGEARERAIRAAFEELREAAPLELRLGFELTPWPALLRDEPVRYALEGTDAVLVEIPFLGPADGFLALAGHIHARGLTPVVAHPERTEAVRADPELPLRLAGRGWPLQVNASSLLGSHGPEAEEIGWGLVERGAVAAVASDGHRLTRPPRLDDAYELVQERVGEEAAAPLFDGSPITGRRVTSERRLPSRAAAPGA